MEKTKFDENCIELLNEAPKRHSRHCFRSALNHLERAERLLTIDPEMSVFRGVTAEEEAASGLMMCLKELGYQNADKLKPRDHVQKSAVVPFFSILGSFFHETFLEDMKLIIQIGEIDGERRLKIGIPMENYGIDKLAYPIPPLNFAVTSDEKRPSYKHQIASFIETSGTRDILSYIKKQANIRNTVLYARNEGYPSLEHLKPDFLITRQRRVLAMMRAYLFIFPYRELQPFVQDALDAYLAMLGVLKDHGLNDDV